MATRPSLAKSPFLKSVLQPLTSVPTKRALFRPFMPKDQFIRTKSSASRQKEIPFEEIQQKLLADLQNSFQKFTSHQQQQWESQNTQHQEMMEVLKREIQSFRQGDHPIHIKLGNMGDEISQLRHEIQRLRALIQQRQAEGNPFSQELNETSSHHGDLEETSQPTEVTPPNEITSTSENPQTSFTGNEPIQKIQDYLKNTKIKLLKIQIHPSRKSIDYYFDKSEMDPEDPHETISIYKDRQSPLYIHNCWYELADKKIIPRYCHYQGLASSKIREWTSVEGGMAEIESILDEVKGKEKYISSQDTINIFMTNINSLQQALAQVRSRIEHFRKEEHKTETLSGLPDSINEDYINNIQLHIRWIQKSVKPIFERLQRRRALDKFEKKLKEIPKKQMPKSFWTDYTNLSIRNEDSDLSPPQTQELKLDFEAFQRAFDDWKALQETFLELTNLEALIRSKGASNTIEVERRNGIQTISFSPLQNKYKDLVESFEIPNITKIKDRYQSIHHSPEAPLDLLQQDISDFNDFLNFPLGEETSN